jgi:hypothetical protein
LEVGAEGRDEVTVPIPRTHPSVERPGLAFRHFVRADVVTVDPAGHATAKAQLTLLSSRALYEIAARTVPRVKGRDPGFATRFLGLTISTPANTVRPVRASDVGLSLGVPDRSVKVGSRVGGTVRVSEPVHRLSVSLVRKESRSHGLRDDQSVSDAHRVATTQLEAAAGIDIPFSLEVPPDAVPTVLAAQRSIRWYVNAEAAPKGLLAPSAETEVELNVYNGDG